MVTKCFAEDEKPYHIQTIKSDTGLFMEEIGKINIYKEDWKIITHINMSEYVRQHQHIETIIRKVFNICNKLKPYEEESDTVYTVRGGCGPILEQIKIFTEDLGEQSAKWFMKQNRKKRGLMNIVGVITKGLFGILNENDAQQYYKQFKDLQEKSEKTERITEEQTTLLQAVINLIKNNEGKINKQTKSINEQIQRIEAQLPGIRNDTYKFIRAVALKRNVQMLMDYVIVLLMNFQNKQRQFIEMIAIGHKTPNSPALVQPSLFLEELIEVQNIISTRDLKMPLEVKRENLAAFYHITTPEMAIIEDQLIFSFKIPLIQNKNFTVYKVNSLPMKWKEEYYSYIVPTYEFVALDSYMDNYITLTYIDLENCYHIQDRELICAETSPIMHTKVMNNCEINFIKNLNNTENCNIRVGKFENEIWIKLRQENSWLFVLPKEQKVFINCKKYFENLELKETGIIELQPGCQIKTISVLISAFRSTETLRTKQIFPKINWKEKLNEIIGADKQISKSFIKTNIEPKIIAMNQPLRLTELSLSLEKIKEIEEQYRQTTTHKVTNKKIGFLQILVWIIITIIILILCKIIWEIIILHKNKNKKKISHERKKNLIGLPKLIKKSQKQEEIELYEDMTANTKVELPTTKG